MILHFSCANLRSNSFNVRFYTLLYIRGHKLGYFATELQLTFIIFAVEINSQLLWNEKKSFSS